MDESLLSAQVVYAPPPPGSPVMIAINVTPGTTIRQALVQSAITSRVPELDIGGCKVGVWGKLRGLDMPVEPQARIEIYRPLIADPKESRRQRAKQ